MNLQKIPNYTDYWSLRKSKQLLSKIKLGPYLGMVEYSHIENSDRQFKIKNIFILEHFEVILLFRT